MRKLFVIGLFCLTGLVAKAQTDYCKDVKKTYDEFKKETKYASPNQGYKLDINAQRIITPDLTTNQLVLSFISKEEDYNAKEVFIKFSDDSIFSDESSELRCKYLSGGDYIFVAVISGMNEDQLDKLKKLKIVKIRIGRIEKEIPDKMATKVQGYINCVFKDENK